MKKIFDKIFKIKKTNTSDKKFSEVSNNSAFKKGIKETYKILYEYDTKKR